MPSALPAESFQANQLASKLARILGEIETVPKSGYNDFHGYSYITGDDLMHAVRVKLSAAGIFVFTSIESQAIREVVSGEHGKEKRSFLTEITLKHTFIDGESGGQFSVLSQGQGGDVGDKGGYKAITGAMKYFIYKCFMIATEDGAPDGDQVDRQRMTADPARSSAPANTTRSVSDKITPSPQAGQINWREVVISFGNYKGVKLGDMAPKQLEGWFKWTPNPKYKVSAADALLKDALAQAQREIQG